LNMGTEASYRFERGVDPDGTVRALARAARLMVEIAGAEAVPGGLDIRRDRITPPPITLRVKRTGDLLGMVLSAAEIKALLEGIEIGVECRDAETLLVTPPGFRVDLEREIDLIEEVTRLRGYNEIPATLPKVPMSFPEQDESRALFRQAAAFMVGRGFAEAINYSFVAAQHFDRLGLAMADPARSAVRLLNPLSEEQAVMRTTLLPGLLENLQRNVNYQNNEIRLFEIGKVFAPRAGQDLPREQVRLTALMSGRRYPGSPLLYFGTDVVDIFDSKGLAEQLLKELRRPATVLDRPATAAQCPAYAEADCFAVLRSTARPDGAAPVELGCFGKISRSVLKAFGIKQEAFFLDLDLAAIAALPPLPKTFVPLPRFPAVKWDIAVVVPERSPAGEMLAALINSGETLLETAEIFDVYRGQGITAGYKSVAISVTYRSEQHTLEDEEVGGVHQKLIAILTSRFEAQLREAV